MLKKCDANCDAKVPHLWTDCLHNTDCRFIKEKKQSVIKHI